MVCAWLVLNSVSPGLQITIGLPPRLTTVLQRDRQYAGKEKGNYCNGKLHTLLVGVQALFEDIVAGKDHDDREVLVDES